jgi:hypothetical protein
VVIRNRASWPAGDRPPQHDHAALFRMFTDKDFCGNKRNLGVTFSARSFGIHTRTSGTTSLAPLERNEWRRYPRRWGRRTFNSLVLDLVRLRLPIRRSPTQRPGNCMEAPIAPACRFSFRNRFRTEYDGRRSFYTFARVVGRPLWHTGHVHRTDGTSLLGHAGRDRLAEKSQE